MITSHAKLLKQFSSVRSAVTFFRGHAFDFASAVIEIREKWHNEFLKEVASSKLNVDAWMDEHFGPIEDMGDSRKALMAAIKEGMTKKEYVAQGPVWLIRKEVERNKKDAGEIRETPMADVALATATPRERLALYKAQNEALRAQVRELRSQVRDLNQKMERVLATNVRIRKQAKKADKILATV